MQNSVICVFVLIEYGDFVVLVILTATFLSVVVDIEWENSRLADSVNYSNGVTTIFIPF